MIKTIEFLPDHSIQFDVSCQYPVALMDEKPFRDLIENIYPLFVRCIELNIEIIKLEKERSKFLLDVSRKKFTERIKTLRDELSDVEKNMNKDLSPYFWCCDIGSPNPKLGKTPRKHYVFYLDKLDGYY